MYHIIINPASKSGYGRLLWKDIIEPYLTEHNVSYKAHLSKRSGDVAEIARKIYETENELPLRIIVLGGDGTVNEFVQTIPEAPELVLGYIPTGSSNDLARALKIPSDPIEALRVILTEGKEETIDLGQLKFQDGSKHLFIVSCGIGFDAAVCEEAMHSKFKETLNKLRLGKLTYLAIAIKQICTAKRASGTLSLKGQPPIFLDKLLFTTGMNHRYEGGGFLFCPKASNKDGLLDLCVIDNISAAKVIFALPFGLKGKHLIFSGISAYQATGFEIKLDRELWVHTDGEVHKKADYFKAKCLPQALKIIVP